MAAPILVPGYPPLLRVRGLKKHYPVHKGTWPGEQKVLRAVDGVSFTLNAGETLSLVGESGCGKSTTGRAILRLVEPTEGEIAFQGVDIRRLSQKELRPIRREMQMMFQDPFASLHPRMRVEELVAEPLSIHGVSRGAERRAVVLDLLDKVGLGPQHLRRYPHEFSGGQRQRIALARALALNPRLLVCDEPVSALDVSIRSQVINLMMDLQEELGMAYLFISHDLGVVRHISTRVAVMYLGQLVEIAPVDQIFDDPKHPYTQALLSAIPRPDPIRQRQQETILLEGDLPSPASPPPGCRFHTRCPFAEAACKEGASPGLRDVGNGHLVACHLAR